MRQLSVGEKGYCLSEVVQLLEAGTDQNPARANCKVR